MLTAAAAAGAKTVTVDCPSSTGSSTSIRLNGTLASGNSLCDPASDEATATVPNVPQANLTLVAPANSTACFGVNNVSAVFTYTVEDQTSLTWSVTPNTCSFTNGECLGCVLSQLSK